MHHAVKILGHNFDAQINGGLISLEDKRNEFGYFDYGDSNGILILCMELKRKE